MGVKFSPPETGGNFIKAEEKAVLIDNAVPLPVVRVFRGPDTFNPGKERYTLVVDLNGEERSMGFAVGASDGKQTSRDVFLESLGQHVELEDAEPVSVVLKKNGKFITVEVADEA